MTTVDLTDLQRDEVAGLLDVCTDDHANGDRNDAGWGTLTGHRLVVHDPAEAVADLRDRARWAEDESYVHDVAIDGARLARVLRHLADRIAAS